MTTTGHVKLVEAVMNGEGDPVGIADHIHTYENHTLALEAMRWLIEEMDDPRDLELVSVDTGRWLSWQL